MGGKKGNKNVNSSGGSTDDTLSDPPSPPSSPPLSKQKQEKVEKKQKKKEKDEQIDDDRLSSEDTQGPGLYIIIVNFACLALSFLLVVRCPIPDIDVKKQSAPGHSFFYLYFHGHLDHVAHITQMLIAAVFSLFFDFFVIGFHILNPPHPKFVLSVKRKVCIYLHLVSGITEIVSGVLAFTIADNDTQLLFSQIMSSASLLHGITAFYQTGIVFGAKGIMVPGYIYAITLHLTNAYRLYYEPGSLVYLIFTFLVLHIYVWCRFFIFFFRVLKMFDGFHYTVAITLSGLLLFPFVVGPIGNFGMLAVVITFCVLEALLSGKSGIDLSERLFQEHERYALITSEQVIDWRSGLRQSNGIVDADREAAKAVYDKIVASGHELSAGELHRLLKLLAIPSLTCKKVLAFADEDKGGTLNFEEFYRHVWHINSVSLRIKKVTGQRPAAPTDKDKAKLVFEMLDVNDSGFIGVAELDMLLTQWGLPYNESTTWLRQHTGSKHKINFDEFYKQLRPVWDFAYFNLYS